MTKLRGEHYANRQSVAMGLNSAEMEEFLYVKKQLCITSSSGLLRMLVLREARRLRRLEKKRKGQP